MRALRVLRSPWVAIALGAVGLMLAAAWAPPVLGATATKHDVKVASFQFGFTPNVIRVNLGDEVVIKLSSKDVSHGFYLDGYGIQEKVDPGQAKEIRFTADRAGTYRFRCAVTCGSLHPFMIGQLVVEPNVPFGAAAAVIGGTGVLGYVWSVRRREASL